jgi:hypothetical protein
VNSICCNKHVKTKQKQKKSKRAGDIAVLERLLSVHKALGLITSTTKRKKEKDEINYYVT